MRAHRMISCAIACGLFAHAASAERIGVIAVARDAGKRAAAGGAVSRGLGEEPGAPIILDDALAVARTNLARGAIPIARLAAFRHVRSLVDEGWGAYLGVEFELAQERLAVARTEAEPLVALPGGPELYADVSLRLGIVLGALGHTSEAQATIALALALDRDRPITRADFSPEVVGVVDAVRAMVPAHRKTSILTEPPGAAITLDGAAAGVTPAVLDLTVGQHVVIARAGVHRPSPSLCRRRPRRDDRARARSR